MSLRLHLLELEDLPFFPARLRDLMTDALAALQATLGVHEAMAELLRDALEQSDAHELVDLCSGAGGVLPRVRRAVARKGWSLRVLFTDRFPNHGALAATCRREPDALRFVPHAVDAAAVPEALPRFRTMFTSFHHFRPREARAILENAHRSRASIAIFEITERSWTAFFRNSLTPLACWLLTPRLRPLSFERLLFTYLIPIVPLVLTWDGFVSNLRTYTPAELTQLCAGLDDEHYTWRVGTLRGSYGQVTTHLLGIARPIGARNEQQLRSRTTTERMTDREDYHVSV